MPNDPHDERGEARRDKAREGDDFLHSERYFPPLPRRRLDGPHGAARFADEEELGPWLLSPREPDASLILPGFSPIVDAPASPRGYRGLYGRSLRLPESVTTRHTMVVGQPGSGKTTQLIGPLFRASLACPEASTVMFVAKADQEELFQGALVASGKHFRIFSLTDPERSAGWNPTNGRQDEGTALSVSHHVCHAFDQESTREDSPFWINNSIRLIAGIILALSEEEGPGASIPRVREILELPRDRFDLWLAEHDHIPQLGQFRSFLRSGSQNAETILSDAEMRLKTYLDPDLCAVLGTNDLDFEELITQPTVLLIEMSETRIDELRATWNLFLRQMFDHLARRGDEFPHGRLPRPVHIIIDEFASALGRLPNFEIRVNTLRSRRVSVITAVQNLSQIHHVYGSAAGPLLGAFATKIFLPGLDPKDAAYASALAGTTTVDDIQTLEELPGEDDDLATPEEDAPRPRRSRHRRAAGRPLLSPEAIMCPPVHPYLGAPATLFLPRMHPFQAWMAPVYESAGYLQLLEARGDVRLADPMRRHQPLVYKRPLSATRRRRKKASEPEFSDTDRLSPPARARLLQIVRERIGYDAAPRLARLWWNRAQGTTGVEHQRAIRFAEELIFRKVSLTALHAARVPAGTDSPSALLLYLAFLERRRDADGAAGSSELFPPPDGGDPPIPLFEEDEEG